MDVTTSQILIGAVCSVFIPYTVTMEMLILLIMKTNVCMALVTLGVWVRSGLHSFAL